MKTDIIEEDRIEFAVFCIENTARYLHADPETVYKALTGKDRILTSYIMPSYEVLHTQSKEYIVNDIVEAMKKKGISV